MVNLETLNYWRQGCRHWPASLYRLKLHCFDSLWICCTTSRTTSCTTSRHVNMWICCRRSICCCTVYCLFCSMLYNKSTTNRSE